MGMDGPGGQSAGIATSIDPQALLADMELDEAEIRWRKEFVGFDSRDVHRLETIQPAVSNRADELAEAFYDHILEFDETTAVIDRAEVPIDRLTRTQARYLIELVGGEYDRSYFANRARIGKTHDLLDMPMKMYLGQFLVYYEQIFSIVRDRIRDRIFERIRDRDETGSDIGVRIGSGGSPVQQVDSEIDGVRKRPPSLEDIIETELATGFDEILALLKITSLDMQIVVDAYLHSYNAQLSETAERQRRLMARIEGELKGPIASVTDAAADVADIAATINDEMTTQSADIADVATDVTALSESIDETAHRAETVARRSTDAEQAASAGRDAATEARETMATFEALVAEVISDLEQLNDRIEEIADVTSIIDDIADQTNLLALNASIEAARAGEAGGGFGVVADEITELANRTKRHATEIDSTLDTVQRESDATIAGLHAAADQFDTGIEQLDQTMAEFDRIVETVNATADGINAVSSATAEHARAADSTAATLEAVAGDIQSVRTDVGAIAASTEGQRNEIRSIAESARQLSFEST